MNTTTPTPTKADKKFLALFILVLVLIIGFIAVYTMNFLKEEQEFQRIKAEAATICENAGFTDVIAHVEGPEKGYGYETYTLTVTYKGTEKIGSGKLRNILEALNQIDITLKDSILTSRFRMDGEHYWISAYDGTLYRGITPISTPGGTQSTYISGNPYEGMSEDSINYTDLGPADDVEKCKDFSALREERRTKTYRWYNANGRTKAIATVSYKNGKGYVSSFSLLEYDAEAVKEARQKLKEEKKSTGSDPYHASDYSDSEDFYEDYYDDFYDYEDAEDYYYDHS